MHQQRFWEVLGSLSSLKWRGGDQRLRVRMEGPGVPDAFALCCPITAVCFQETGEFFRTDEWEAACVELNLDMNFADDVVAAADHIPGAYKLELDRVDEEFRNKLLEVVGMDGS